MNTEKINALSTTVGNSVRFAQEVSTKIINGKAIELDKLIDEIKTNAIEAPNIDDATIEQYMIKLVLTLYSMNTQIDTFSFYDAMSDMNALLTYNEKYAESQAKAAIDGKKLTKDDHQQYAENNTVDEKILNLIYSKSVKALKDKINGGYELLDVLKRILKHHEQETFYDRQTNKILQ